MSTVQRNDACVLAVDPVVAGTLRTQTLRVLESNHYYFEELLEFGPDAQLALSVIYRDAFAVLDALGWHPGAEGAVEVPLTAGHIDQLRRRRHDLAHTNLDRLPAPTEPIAAETQQAIAVDRQAIAHLSTLIAHFDNARRSERP